jgi:hypothetical protein
MDLRHTPSSADVGSEWLSWDPGATTWRLVEILEAAGPKPQRIRVQHLDVDMGGKSEWVPSKRLHVPASLREEYLASLAVYDRLASEAPPAHVSDVALLVLAECVPSSIADMDQTGAQGIVRISDVVALTAVAGTSVEELCDHEKALVDGSKWYLPWSATQTLLCALVRLHPEPAMRLLDQMTRRRQRFDLRVADQGEPWWMNEDQAEGWARRLDQWHDAELDQIEALRYWLNRKHPSLAESYLELKKLHAEMVAAINEAIPRIKMVRAHKSIQLARHLEDLANRPAPLLDVRGLLTDREIEEARDEECG